MMKIKIFYGLANKAQITKDFAMDNLIPHDFNSLDVNVSDIKWHIHLGRAHTHIQIHSNTHKNKECPSVFVRSIKSMQFHFIISVMGRHIVCVCTMCWFFILFFFISLSLSRSLAFIFFMNKCPSHWIDLHNNGKNCMSHTMDFYDQLFFRRLFTVG